jgi:hypothetical protein
MNRLGELQSIRRNLFLLRREWERMSRSFWDRKYDPEQPRVPAGNSGGGQWTSDSNSDADARDVLAEDFATDFSAARRISPALEAFCESQRIRDELQCRFVGVRACWAQAYLRYSNCLVGLPIPPLVWN